MGVIYPAVPVEDVVAELERQALVGAVALEEGQGGGRRLKVDEVQGPAVGVDFGLEAVAVEVHPPEMAVVALAARDLGPLPLLGGKGLANGVLVGIDDVIEVVQRKVVDQPFALFDPLGFGAVDVPHFRCCELFVRPSEVVFEAATPAAFPAVFGVLVRRVVRAVPAVPGGRDHGQVDALFFLQVQFFEPANGAAKVRAGPVGLVVGL